MADKQLAERLTPNFQLGCKRITPHDTYMEAFNSPNVHLETSPIDVITPEGIRTGDGKEIKCDVIIFATGFDVMDSFLSFPKYGKAGKEMMENFKTSSPRAFNGTTFVSHFTFSIFKHFVWKFDDNLQTSQPNYFMILGPNTGLGHSSIIYIIERQVEYTVECIRSLVEAGKQSMEVKDTSVRAFVNEMDE